MSEAVTSAKQVKRPAGLRAWGPIRILLDPFFWGGAIYLVLGLGLGIAWLVALLLAIPTSIAFVIVWIGLPMLALTMIGWRGAAMLERRLVRAAFGVEIPDPYRPMPEQGLLGKWKTMIRDPATWKDLAYLFLRFPTALAEFVVSAVVWPVTGVLLLSPVITAFPDAGPLQVNFGGRRFIIDSPVEALPWMLLGLLLLPIALYVVRWMSIGHVAFAKTLLGRSRKGELAARAAYLESSRARGVTAADTERRRIERDLHDGAQQRLISVAMDLGRAREKFDEDPVAARALLEQAHHETKATIVELRDLARGIYPAILTDRGLDAALSALAARASVHVDVTVELNDRLPAAVEGIAYFIVAEALTNMTKHSAATEASVRVTRAAKQVVIEVTDNGVGNAIARPGGGLAGLMDRAATVDGVVGIDSPPSGPTTIRAELPCE